MAANDGPRLVTAIGQSSGELQLKMLRGLRVETQQVRLRSSRGSTDRTFRGPTLFAYARAAGLVQRRSSGARFEASYFLVTAADGAQVSVAYAEVIPSLSRKQVVLAFEQDGEPIRSGVRLVVPGDDLGGRSLSGVVTIAAHEVPVVETEQPFQLTGLLDRPGTVTVDALAAGTGELIVTGVGGHGAPQTLPPRRYTGRGLYELLTAAGIQQTSASPEDFLRKVVVARGADGHTVVIAGGEIAPHFMNGDVLVAAARDGQLLADSEGPVRLIAPLDRGPGRSVKQLVRLELIDG